jgi:hypothetical protein
LQLRTTPPLLIRNRSVSILLRSSVTPLVADVRIGDELTVERDGKHWWASSATGRLGRLTWSEEDQIRVT